MKTVQVSFEIKEFGIKFLLWFTSDSQLFFFFVYWLHLRWLPKANATSAEKYLKNCTQLTMRQMVFDLEFYWFCKFFIYLFFAFLFQTAWELANSFVSKMRKLENWTKFIRKVFFYFPLPIYGRKSIVLGSNFQNGDFEGFTHFEVP